MNRVDTDRLKADLRHVVEDVERVLHNAANVTAAFFLGWLVRRR